MRDEAGGSRRAGTEEVAGAGGEAAVLHHNRRRGVHLRRSGPAGRPVRDAGRIRAHRQVPGIRQRAQRAVGVQKRRAVRHRVAEEGVDGGRGAGPDRPGRR